MHAADRNDAIDITSRRGGRDSCLRRAVTRRAALAGATTAAVGMLAACNAPASDNGGSGSSSHIDGDAISNEAPQVKALDRPQLVTLPADDDTLAAPALASYVDDSSVSSASEATDSLGLDPFSAANADAYSQITYLGDDFLACLGDNGFAVDASYGYDEFFTLYESNRYLLQANFVTVDSLMHTYHLYFAHLLKSCESSTLSGRVATMSRQLHDAALAQLDALTGSEWEQAAERNVAFFAVALQLFGQEAQVPSDYADAVSAEVDAIEAAEGIATSALTGGLLDYSQFKPRGYYEGNDQLERYFRVMSWYGQVNFQQSDEGLDRSACLITMALHDAALSDWEAVYAITSFFAGASDDSGYYEYWPLVEEAFGEGVTASDLVGNDDGWQTFHALTATMDPPKINSVVYIDPDAGNGEIDENSEEELDAGKGFRLMGQRFSLDEAIFEQLLPKAIGKNSQGEDRNLPSGLDVPAALGSDEALSILADAGATDYEGYSDNMEELRAALANAGDELWETSLYSQWLYTLNPLLATHDETYPSFMRTALWRRRDLQAYLGSYAELKHDTVLYTKQVMAESGGDLPTYDDRGYVQPEAELYRRMGNLVRCTSTGLSGYGALSDDDASNLDLLASLADQLQAIAEAELAGTALTDDQYELIRSYGAQIEHFWYDVNKGEAEDEYFDESEFPAAIIVDIASNANTGTCLEVGTGKVDTVYVLFELDGQLHIASGGVFSYYEFEQPLSERLTDSVWRYQMGIQQGEGMSYVTEPAYDQPSWVDGFTFARD